MTIVTLTALNLFNDGRRERFNDIGIFNCYVMFAVPSAVNALRDNC
jgi:hypothetical protein